MRMNKSDLLRLSDAKLAERVRELEREVVRLRRTVDLHQRDTFVAFQEFRTRLTTLEEHVARASGKAAGGLFEQDEDFDAPA
jgi:hypothetical protein